MIPIITLRRFLIFTAFALVAILGARPHVYDPDMPWHIRSGQIMLQTGDVIRGDLYSHTLPGVLRPHHEWLSEVIDAVLYNAFGNYGMVLMSMFFTLMACGVMYKITRGDLTVRLMMVVMAGLATSVLVMSRPQGWMLTFTLILTHMVIRRSIPLWWIPVIMVTWVNLHAGWITGYLVLGAAVTGEFLSIVFKRGGDVVWLRRLVIWSLVGILALLINPYGLEQMLVPLDTFTQAARPYITEWSPPDLLELNRLTYDLLLYMGVVVVIAHYRKLSLTELLILGGFMLWSVRVTRVVILYSLIAPVIITPYVSAFMRRVTPSFILSDARLDRPVRFGAGLVALLSVAVIAVSIFAVSPARIRVLLDAYDHPVDAVEFLRAEGAPQRELFNDYNWGGYLIAELPSYPVFIDTRADLYDDFFFVYRDVVQLREGWEAVFTRYDIQTVLIKPTSRLAGALRQNPAWRVVYEDEFAVIFRPAS